MRAAIAVAALLSIAEPSPVVTDASGVVVAPDRYAALAGKNTLAAGGSAIDAAIAATFVLSVSYPPAAPLGGGGFLLYRGPDGEAHALDFRETAPAALDAALFLDEEGRPVPERSLTSGLAVGIPGTLSGLREAHRRWGRLPWPELVEPAIGLAAEGFVVSPWLAANLAAHRELLSERPATRAIFVRDGQTPKAGERLVQRDLARTLRRIATSGPHTVYSGPVAKAIARSVRAEAGVLSREDLERYRCVTRDALEGRYRGHRVLAFPPPSSGGVALLQMLGMLEAHDLAALGSGAESVHLVAEIERRAFADRARWLGDPDYVKVPLAALLAPAYLRERASSIDPARATPSAEVAADPRLPAFEPGQTLHLSTADSSGAVVALTATLNAWYGSGIVARGTGILLNNEMDDFALSPGSPNYWGVTGGEANALEAGKRPLSSMTPTIVEAANGGARPRLVLGSPGGPAIITSVLQVVLNVIDHGMTLGEAVSARRFHHQWQPDRILHERGAFDADVARKLIALGHTLVETPQTLGDVNAIGLDAHERWVGAPDPRRSSAALGAHAP